MARGRMLSRSISTSRKVNVALREALGRERQRLEFAQLLYSWILPHCDDFGRIEGDAATVKGTVIPLSSRTAADVTRALTALAEVGLIQRYQVDGQWYIQVVQWDDHQTGLHKRTRSRFPESPGNSGKSPESPGNSLRTERNGTEQNNANAMKNMPSPKGHGEESASEESAASGLAAEILRTMSRLAGPERARRNAGYYRALEVWAGEDTGRLAIVRAALTQTRDDARSVRRDGRPVIRTEAGAYFAGVIRRECERRGLPPPA